MKTSTLHTTSFLLIDGALAGLVLAGPALAEDDRPGWLHPLYSDDATAVGPLLIDIEAAQEAGQLDEMMALANAVRPQLHASLIDTALSHAELIEHLRRFIAIRTESGQAFTLRFADCVALPNLATIFSPAQWAAVAGPIVRWCVHGRNGAMLTLPDADAAVAPAQTPLVLTAQQFDEVAEAAAPDMLLAHIRDARHGDELPGNAAQQHCWASEARQLWRAAGNAHDIVLRWLTTAALDTGGAVLRLHSLPALLEQPEQSAIRAGLLAEVAIYQAKPAAPTK